jgi:hypothetical protein
LPASDGPGTLARLRVVGDAREPPAQLDRGREFATLLEDGTDRGSLCLRRPAARPQPDALG